MVESATWVFWFVSSVIFHVFGTQVKIFSLHLTRNLRPWRIFLWLATQRIGVWEKIKESRSLWMVGSWAETMVEEETDIKREQKRYIIIRTKWTCAKIKCTCTRFESLNLDRWIKLDSVLLDVDHIDWPVQPDGDTNAHLWN